MATNADYCKRYRKCMFNCDGRVQQTPAFIPLLQPDTKSLNDKEIVNNEFDDFFDQMNERYSNRMNNFYG